MKIRVSGVGCSLIDYLYTNVSFESESFRRYRSRSEGDGGLSPGKLVFAQEFEAFAGKELDDIQEELTEGRDPDTSNLGGPSVVALIHAAQLLAGSDTSVSFYGARGADATAVKMIEILRRTPVDTKGYRVVPGQSPFTIVLSDPGYDGGHGERTFINNIGAAGNFGPEDIDSTFFQGDILAFGGTGLVPRLHARIDEPLRRAKEYDRLTVVNTVYDFLNEKAHPESKWPVGANDDTFRYIDLFIADREEALRTTGTTSVDDAIYFLKDHGVKATIITQGPAPVVFAANGKPFQKSAADMIPVCDRVAGDRASGVARGDTTGCGDNFVGGVLASLVGQLRGGMSGQLDLRLASSLGVVSGGYACYYVGGTFIESRAGEKRANLTEMYRSYLKQTDFAPRNGDGIIE